MNKLTVIIVVLAGSLFLLTTAALVFQEDADAIPAFARKYRVSCSMCHVAAPKLKPYGESFAGNGFVLPDGEEPKRSTIDTGDPALLLMRSLPLAVRFDGYLQAQNHETVDADIQTPYGVKLLSGGRIARSVSYYFYFYIFERGEVAGLEDAYLHFNNLGGIEFDIMAGQFQVSDPLFKRELRLTFADYLIYRTRPGDSLADLTYDRGLMLTYSFGFGLDMFGQIVNGNGIPAAENRIFDLDTDKAYSLRASQSLGPVRIGAFGYYNTETTREEIANELWYGGADATLGGEKWEFNVQYLHREDSNPYFTATDSVETTIDGGFAEFLVMPKGDQSKWIVIALYNFIDGSGDDYDLNSATLSLNHVAARNLRFILEYTQDIDNDKASVTFGAMAAF